MLHLGDDDLVALADLQLAGVAERAATRLSASEAFLVKTTSSRSGAPMKRATVSRAPSNASVASAPSWCIARATLALWCSRWSTIASITTCGFCEVLALSR